MELAGLGALGKVMRIRVGELHIHVQFEAAVDDVRLKGGREWARVEGNQHFRTPVEVGEEHRLQFRETVKHKSPFKNLFLSHNNQSVRVSEI